MDDKEVERLSNEVNIKYDELIKILESQNTAKSIRDIKLLNSRKDYTSKYYKKFIDGILVDYPDFGLLLAEELEGKRFAAIYTFYLEQLRLNVEAPNGGDTLMSIYKIIAASQATIVSISPIVRVRQDSKIENELKTTSELNGGLAYFYAIELLTDWISAVNTQNQDFSYRVGKLFSDQYVKELTQEHTIYLSKKVMSNLQRKEKPFELLMMAQYWKIFHYYLFDPRTMETESI